MKKLNHWMFESENGAWFIKRAAFIMLLTFACMCAAMQMTICLEPKSETVDFDYDSEYNLSESYAILYRNSGIIEFYTDGEIFTYMRIDTSIIGTPDLRYANTIFAYFASHNVLKVVVAHKVITTIDTSPILDLEYDLGTMLPVMIVNG